MALNVALPLSGLSDLFYERCALLSPIEPDFEDNLELLVTPYESSECSESGIGSSESKNQKPSSDDDEEAKSNASTTASTPENESDAETDGDESLDSTIVYEGRDILDLAKNLTDSTWKFQYAQLPENNLPMFMQNRSLYHRLGADGLNCDFEMASCGRCTFQFPVMSHDKAQNKPSVKTYRHF